jgi:signal transduction histidine kinase
MTLQGRLEMLQEELALADPDLVDGRRHLADARDQADRLGRLAGDLLDLSRLDAEVELHAEAFDTGELVRAVAAEFSARTETLGRDVELDLLPVDAFANPTACARVVRTLLDNALAYAGPAGPIQVGITTGPDHVAVAVSDPGPAIPEEDKERIFERFARGSGSNRSGGFGLGLAIARELSERMGGTLELENGDGPGNTFALRLPLVSAISNGIPTKASSV